MSILDILFDRSKQRRKRLEDLHAQRAQLRADFEAAAVAGDDTDKLFAKLEKCDAEIRSAEAALEVVAAERRRQEEAARQAEIRAAEFVMVRSAVAYAQTIKEFDALAQSLATSWRRLYAAFKVAHNEESRGQQKGSKLRTLSERRIMHPAAIWSNVFMVLMRALWTPGETMLLFPAAPGKQGMKTATENADQFVANLPGEGAQ